MQIVYKFRVSFEEHDEVVRFIDIESTSSFADFHKIIQTSVGFDASKDYSFYLSDDIWRVNREICNSDSSGEGGHKSPEETSLNKFINDPHQRFIYLFDPELVWSFFIQFVKILKAEPHKKYPLLARKEGEAPKQYKLKGKLPGATPSLNEYDKMAEMLMASRLMEDLSKETEETEEEEDALEDLEITDAEIPDIVLPEIEKQPLEKPVVKPAAILDLKFEEEELTIDADDFDLLEGEEGEATEDEEEEKEDDYGFDDFSGYGQGDDNDEY